MTAEHENETAVVVREDSAVVLWGTNEPLGMTARMTAIADAMADAVRKRGMANKIDGREYVRAEGWALVGAMLGVFPRTSALDEIREDGALVGFRATTELVSRDGAVVGGAVALCTISEEKWRGRDWNQIASMAQTRANAKAYRQTLGFIMPMAGYAATPAEEMDGIHAEEAPTRQGGPKQNGVTPPPEHLESVGHLMNYAKYHHNIDSAKVGRCLEGPDGNRTVPEIVEQDFDGSWDEAAAYITKKVMAQPVGAK